MTENIGLIPARNAMIVWKPRKKQEDFDLKVYYKDIHLDHKEFCKQMESDPHWRYPCSSGSALVVWPQLSEVQMFRECMKILFKEGVTNKEKVKGAIFEFGKILELREMRILYHGLYYEDQMPFEGLEKSFYAWDFCSGGKNG